jgi:hypothetical protein
MSKAKTLDLLADGEIRRHTERILALREEERQIREKLGRIIAAIGAELIAVKEARTGSQCTLSPRRVARRNRCHADARVAVDRPSDRTAETDTGDERP